MAPDSLRFRLDRLREESFARGAAKPCGEWGGDTLKSLSPSTLAFRRKATSAKIIPPATQSRLQRKTDPKALITSGRLVRQIEISAR